MCIQDSFDICVGFLPTFVNRLCVHIQGLTSLTKKAYMCKKSPVYMSKESFMYFKRDLNICQKRPICSSKETCICKSSQDLQKPLHQPCLTNTQVSFDIYVKRDLYVCHKRPACTQVSFDIYVKRDLYVCQKRPAYVSLYRTCRSLCFSPV